LLKTLSVALSSNGKINIFFLETHQTIA